MTFPAPGPDPSPAPRVLVADPISGEGIELLREGGAEVLDLSGAGRAEVEAAVVGCDALVVRSRTKVDARLLEAGTRLRVVGRAGTGVDNVDVEAATRRGVAGAERAEREPDLGDGALLRHAARARAAASPRPTRLDEARGVGPQVLPRRRSSTARRSASSASAASASGSRRGRAPSR